MSQVDCAFELNPDISGIGVRIAVYIQSVVITISIILTGASGPDEEARMAADYSFAYIAYFIASFVQSHNQQMNILDGFVVFMTSTIPMLMLLYIPLVAAVGRSAWAWQKESSPKPIAGGSSESITQAVHQLSQTSAIQIASPTLPNGHDNNQISNTSEFKFDKPTEELAPASGEDEGSVRVESKKSLWRFWYPQLDAALLRVIYFILWHVWLLRFTSEDFIKNSAETECQMSQNLIIWDFRGGSTFETYSRDLRRKALYAVSFFGWILISFLLLVTVENMLLHFNTGVYKPKDPMVHGYWRESQISQSLKATGVSLLNWIPLRFRLHTSPRDMHHAERGEAPAYGGSFRRRLAAPSEERRRSLTRLPKWLRVHIMFVQIVLFVIILLLPAIMIIIMLEGTLATNEVRKDFNTWTYGQVAALALGSRQAIQCIVGILFMGRNDIGKVYDVYVEPNLR